MLSISVSGRYYTMIKTILVAEDDKESNDYLSFYLQTKCAKVLSAYNGLEAWCLYQEYKPDLIFADIKMPELDGLGLIEHIRQNDKSTPIVIFSAYSDTEYLLKAIPMHLEAYIYKPITFDKIDFLLNQINTKKANLIKYFVINKTNETFYDYESKTARIGHDRIILSNLEIVLLELLLENQMQIVYYDEIEETLYGMNTNSHNAIKCLVKNLRTKIPTINIQSIPKIGYRLS